MTSKKKGPAELPRPRAGGSYIRDPKSGGLTRVNPDPGPPEEVAAEVTGTNEQEN